MPLPHNKINYYGYKDPTVQYSLAVAVNPTYEVPSLEVSVTPSDNLFEVGANVDFIVDFLFDKGSILIEGEFLNDRAGDANLIFVDTVQYSVINNPITHNHSITEGLKTFNCELAHSSGPQPKDSLNADIDSPYPSGSLFSSFQIEGVLPIFSVFHSETESKDMSMNLEANSLLSYSTTEIILLLAKEKETFSPAAIYKNRFLIPKSWDDLLSGITVMQYNNFTTLDYTIDRTSDFVKQTEIVDKEINGVTQQFIEYVNEGSTLSASALDIKITFNYL